MMVNGLLNGFPAHHGGTPLYRCIVYLMENPIVRNDGGTPIIQWTPPLMEMETMTILVILDDGDAVGHNGIDIMTSHTIRMLMVD